MSGAIERFDRHKEGGQLTATKKLEPARGMHSSMGYIGVGLDRIMSPYL